MSKLSDEELLSILDGVFSFYLGELGHEEDKPRIRQAYNQIVAGLKKPKLTKEFIEKKAIKLHKAVYGSLMKCDFKCHMMIKFREQIRMIFEEEK